MALSNSSPHLKTAALGVHWIVPSLSASSILKREKRLRTKNVHFSCVTVYYFTRRQGFTSVPSQGGSTLGMSSRHNSVRQYTLGEFAREQERLHREMLREHLREEKLNSLKLKVKKALGTYFLQNFISLLWFGWINHFHIWPNWTFYTTDCLLRLFFFFFLLSKNSKVSSLKAMWKTYLTSFIYSFSKYLLLSTSRS